MFRRIFLAALVLAIAIQAGAADIVREAVEARNAGNYGRAVELFRRAVAIHPAVETQLLLAETLAWNKQLDESAQVYGEVRRAHPDLRAATLGLARVRLWQGRYREAGELYSTLLKRAGSDDEAREGLATAAYWSGDYRTAAREFSSLQSDFARRSLAEIRAASRPASEIDAGGLVDGQPFRSIRTAIRGTYFTDPLTKWNAEAGAYRLSSEVGGTKGLPFGTIANETALPSLRLTLAASIGAIRTPDRTHAIGSAAARYRTSPHSTLSLSFAEREIVTNATDLYPFVSAISLRWLLDGTRLASLGAERLRYSDDNRGVAVDGYVLLPVYTRGKLVVRAGASALYRDTQDPRFYVTGVSSRLDESGKFFRYTYTGAYNPYWTPDNLLEGRAIIGVESPLSSSIVRLQADAGYAHDYALGFWPDAGPQPFPSAIGTSRFARSFSPWRVRLSVNAPLAGELYFNLGYEHSSTAYYEANTFHATVGRRR